MQKRKKFVVYLRTPKGDRRLEQVATSPREALQEVFGTLPEHLPPGLPDDARCRLECDGQVLGFCPDELGVLNGALHADDDVLDPRPGRSKVKTTSATLQGYDIWKTIMNDIVRDAARRAGVFDNVFTTRPVAPGHVHQTPNVQQPPPGGAAGGIVEPPKHQQPDSYTDRLVAEARLRASRREFLEQLYGSSSISKNKKVYDYFKGSIVPPPAPSAPASGSTTDAPERTPEP